MALLVIKGLPLRGALARQAFEKPTVTKSLLKPVAAGVFLTFGRLILAVTVP